MATVKLTDAMRSALECAGLDLGDDHLTDGERAVRDAWDRATLDVEPDTYAAIVSGLTDCVNRESDAAEDKAPGARAACTALDRLLAKVQRLERPEREKGEDDGQEYGHPREARS